MTKIGDGVALSSIAHPRRPWWKRPLFWVFQPRVNAAALETVEIEVQDRATVDGVTLFVKMLYTAMPQAEYDALPDRQDLTGLPVHGVTYKDRAHPGCIFRCHAGANWAAYACDTFKATLT